MNSICMRVALSAVLCAGLLGGCTSKAAKRALNKPASDWSDTGFAPGHSKASERRTKNMEPISDETDPEQAVDLLVDQMQREEPGYYIPAEQHLRIWAAKQGVAEVVVRKVRILLKSPRIEVRAPALRLVVAYGRQESMGDLVEVLGDEEYGMRKLAFETLRARTGMDLGFQPSGGEVARAEAADHWRRWWQDQQRAMASGKAAPRYEQPAPPALVKPEQEPRQATTPDGAPLPPPKVREFPN